MGCLFSVVIISVSFCLQAIITVTFDIPGNIKEENLNLFIQVSNTSLLTQKIIVAFYRNSSHATLFIETTFSFHRIFCGRRM